MEYVSAIVIWSNWCLLILVLGASAPGQTPETVLASVNNIEITQKQVDDSVAAQIYPLQQQLYAIRKAALENLVTRRFSRARRPRGDISDRRASQSN